jgi:NADH dehydrogenase FAD-containing subunit
VTSGLKKIEDATTMRHRILVAFERAEDSDDEDERGRLLTFVIIGGGPTGVELAGALAELAKAARARFPPDRPGDRADHSDRARTAAAAKLSTTLIGGGSERSDPAWG